MAPDQETVQPSPPEPPDPYDDDDYYPADGDHP
jgi:hypothetical protein